MMTKKNRLLSVLTSSIALILVLTMIVALVASCGDKKKPEQTTTPTQTVEWPNAGVYYFDAGANEDTLTLSVGGSFALIVKGESFSGTYTQSGETLTLDFAAEDKANATATVADGVITLTYEGATMRMLRKVTYTVSFETNGGNAITPVTVLNGKSAAKPTTDPVKENFLFVGWYADSALTTPYNFEAPVTANTTVYARWVAATVSGVEYNVILDLNYENASALEAKTMGGKLIALPTPEREGYTFKGWWFSAEMDGSKLSYQYKDGMSFDANTTLYALWEAKTEGTKLQAPIVNVEAGSLSWNAVTGARSYAVKVIGPDGQALIDETTASTTINVPFADYAAGDYVISVTALANSGEADNAETIRYYTNKALRTVSIFEVIDSMLVFNTVENAEKYYITVVCGNPDHDHVMFDNGNSRTFNFANCEMTEEGIKFTVTAVAEGYASSTSAEFVYKRTLPAVGGLIFDDATQTLSWNEVANAAYYMVSVKCGNAAHNHDFVNVGSTTSISLKECAPCEGGIQVKILPVTAGYISPAATEYTFNKANLSTPSDLRFLGTTVTWSAVEGAEKYEIRINGTVYEVTETSYDLAALLDWNEGSVYAVEVRALGTSESLWSTVINARYQELSAILSYNKSTLTWSHVVGATSYEVQVNDGEILSVTNGANFAQIALNRAGINTLKVRFADGANRSEWVSMDVYAHTVIFDTRGGSEIAVQYKAVGDLIELPETEKVGYTFQAWYNLPGGPESNGKIYTDELFSESGSIVLYAYYTPDKFVVEYDFGTGGTGDKTSDEVSFDRNYQLTVPTAGNEASAFGGWFSAPYGMGKQYTDAKGNSLAPWTSLEGTTLYAFWIDETLSFSLTRVNGKDAYIVTQGPRIALVDEVTIPATYKGLPVAMVAGNAFLNCTSLKTINLPESIEMISLIDPFTGCTNLEAINVYGDSGRYFSVDGVLFDRGADGSTQTKLVTMPLAKTGTYHIPAGIAEIPERAFENASISKIVIPSSVTKIGKEAFVNCTKLTSVIFESTVGEAVELPLTISARAFSGCTMLEKIILPARLSDIALAKYSLNGDTVVTDVTENAFAGCTALKSITVAANSATYKSIDGVLYSADGKTLYYCPATATGEFTVPAGIQQIAPGAFIGCQGLSKVTIPNTVTLVGECAFYGLNENLTTVVFEGNGFNDVTIGKFAFRDCSKLSTLTLSEGNRISVISEGAFRGCSDLTSFEIPANVTEIKSEAFRDCTNLEAVTFAASTKTLAFGENVFYNCSSIETVTLPANVSTIPGIFSGCTSLTEVNVDENSEYFKSIDGVVFNKDETEILFFPQGKTGDYELPATVTTIANGVFRDVSGLSSLTISNSIAVIGEDAFRGSSIGEILFVEVETPATSLVIGKSAFESAVIGTLELPAHTTEICARAFALVEFDEIVLNEGLVTLGESAFFGADGYYELVVPASVKTIGNFCFAAVEDTSSWWGGFIAPDVVLTVENSVLETIGEAAFKQSGLYSITIPASVKTIGGYAFYQCEDLGEVTFAENSTLKTIGAYAFSETDLESITIPASVETIEAYAFYYIYYLSEVFFEDLAPEAEAHSLVLGAASTNEYNAYVEPQSGTEFGHVFDQCYYLELVDLPAHLAEIGTYSFYRAGYYGYGLEVDFGEDSQLTTIGSYAFASSGIAGTITLPNSLCNQDPITENGVSYDRPGVGDHAFYSTDLENVIFAAGGDKPLSIGAMAFGDCGDLVEVTLPARLSTYTSYTGDVLEALDGGSLVFGGENSWYLSDALENIYVEDQEGALYVDIEGVLYKSNGTDATELIACPIAKSGTVTVPATVTKIHDNAFFYCESLDAIELTAGEKPMTIGNRAFYYCEGIQTLVLPKNVTKVGSEAFVGCSSMSELTLSSALASFDGTMVDDCSALATINIGEDGNGTNYASVDGVLFNADKTVLVLYPSARENETYEIPAGVTVIGANAFAGSQYLSKVTLPTGLVEINSGAFSQSYITEINVPNTVELIGAAAFANCSYLETIIFEEEGTEPLVIQDGAFRYTYGLETVTMPARLSVLGNSVFYKSAMESILFADKSQLTVIGDSAFAMTGLINVELPAGLISMGNEVFYYCEDLLKVTMGEGLLELGNRTFAGCSELTEVYFPASLKKMGYNTFYLYEYDVVACDKLTTIVFAEGSQLEAIPAGTFAFTAIDRFEVPASVKEIADVDLTLNTREYPGAFEGCAALQLISFAEGSQCANIGNRAFLNCTALEFISLPTSVSRLGDSAFDGCTALESITIPETVTNFAYGTFNGCSNLSTVVFNSKATELPAYMFAHCSSLTSFTIPSTVTKIGSNCFYGTALETVVVPASVTDLSGYGIFGGIESLTSVTILGNVTELGEQMFRNCYNLETVVLPDSLEIIRENAFENCASLTTFKLPASLHTLESAFGGSGLAAYEVAEGNTTFAAVEGILYSADMTRIISYPANKVAVSITIPKEVVEIASGTFAGLSTLQEVIFEEGGVAELVIADNAFAGCTALWKIVLPERLIEIGSYAFESCTQLVHVTLPSTLETIGYDAFYGCYRLYEICNKSELELEAGYEDHGSVAYSAIRIYADGESWISCSEDGFITMTEGESVYLLGYLGSDSEVVVPDNVTDIYCYAFFYAPGITKVTLPEGVVSIMEGAFYECEDLVEVVLPSTLDYIEGRAFYYCDALTTVMLPETMGTIEYRAFYYCDSLSEIYIPGGIEVIEENAFYGSADRFLVGATEKPDGWSDSWSGSAEVIWGFDGEEHIYYFDTQGGDPLDSISGVYAIELPIPTRENMYFAGWFDNAECTGTEIKGPYYSTTVNTLYAAWMTQEEYEEVMLKGTSADYAIDATAGASHEGNIVEGETGVWFKVVTGDASIRLNTKTNSGKDTVIYIYDAEMNQLIKRDWSSDENYDYTFEANGTYYIFVRFYYSSTTGTLPVTITVL